MSQASTGDAFAPPREMSSPEEAEAALLAAVTPVGGLEEVPLVDADGRVLAADLVANRTVPPWDNSAMDGYAVRAVDLGSTPLPIGGRVTAGRVFDRSLRPGEAVRIFTGAPIPEGADTVVPQEQAVAEAGVVRLEAVAPGSHIRPAGEDFHRGDVLLKAGKRLLPQDLAFAAAGGHPTLTVRRRPVVALFSTGDEVREPGCDTEPGTIVNSNAYFLHGLIRRLGCIPRPLGILRDNAQAVREALAAAADGADALLTSGGVSGGEEDHVKAAVEALGALHFWRIAIRPGRPLAFGRVGQVPFIGLPGNPVAAFVTFLMFARPALLRLTGAAVLPPERYPAEAGFSYKKRPGRREWLRGSVSLIDGRLVAQAYPNDGSGVFSSVVASSGLIELHEDQGPISPGDMVRYLPFSDLLG